MYPRNKYIASVAKFVVYGTSKYIVYEFVPRSQRKMFKNENKKKMSWTSFLWPVVVHFKVIKRIL